jgi:hypothetical protein
MKLNSEPGLLVLGSRIYFDSPCKDAEVFSLDSIAIASRSGFCSKIAKPFAFWERLALQSHRELRLALSTANTVKTVIDGYRTDLKLAYY